MRLEDVRKRDRDVEGWKREKNEIKRGEVRKIREKEKGREKNKGGWKGEGNGFSSARRHQNRD